MYADTTLHLPWVDAVCAPLILLRSGIVCCVNQYLRSRYPELLPPGQQFLEVVAPYQQEAVATLIETADSAAALTCVIYSAGLPLLVRVSCAPLAEVGEDGRLVTLTLLDEEDEIRREHEARDSLLQSIISHLPLHVFAIDMDGYLIFEASHQERFANMSKYDPPKTLFEFWDGDPLFLEHTRRVLAGETIEGETTVGDIVYETYYTPLNDANKQIIGAVGMSYDVTERMRMQQTVFDTDRLRLNLQKEIELSEMKSKIMRRIAHEFRTPLSTIQLSAQMLERYSDRLSSAERATRIEHILRQTRHITRLLEDIALIVKSQAQRVQINPYAFDLTALFDSVVHDAKAGNGARHQWAVSVAPEVERICADARLIGIVLQNLLANATLYADPGTTITLQAFSEENHLVLRVSDQGIGILPDEQDYVFDVFYRGSNFDERPGLGLGLSLVRDAVMQHNGTIHLESEPGVGTTVTVRLPL